MSSKTSKNRCSISPVTSKYVHRDLSAFHKGHMNALLMGTDKLVQLI